MTGKNTGPHPGRPRWIELEISHACDYRCLHCGVREAGEAPDGLAFESWREVLLQVAGFAAPGAEVSFTAGEPFLYPRLMDLVQKASVSGLGTFLNTHGGHIDEAMAVRIAASGLGALWVSLDGFRPETHDASRGVPGAHRSALLALDRLRRSGYSRSGLVTIVMRHNLGELASLARMAGELGLKGVEFQPLQPYGKEWRSLWPRDGAAVRRALDDVEKARSAGAPVLNPPAQLEAFARYCESPEAEFPGFSCRSAETLIIGRGGAVRLCRYMQPAGRFPEKNLAELWNSGPGRCLASKAAICHKSCLLMGCHFPVSAR